MQTTTHICYNHNEIGHKFDNNSGQLLSLQSLLFNISFSKVLLYSWINYRSTVVLRRFSRLVQLTEIRELQILVVESWLWFFKYFLFDWNLP